MTVSFSRTLLHVVSWLGRTTLKAGHRWEVIKMEFRGTGCKLDWSGSVQSLVVTVTGLRVTWKERHPVVDYLSITRTKPRTM